MGEDPVETYLAGDRVEEKVSRTMVTWKGRRTLASAHVKGRYLEASIDLTRTVGPGARPAKP